MAGIDPLVWKNYNPVTGQGDPSTPLTAETLNQWTDDLVLVSETAEGFAADAQQSVSEAEAIRADLGDTINTWALDTSDLAVAATVSTEGSETRTALSATYARSAVFDVRNFGAVGDGVADDTVAIQAAIDTAHALGGGVAFLPPGTYLVSTTEATDTWVYIGGSPPTEQVVPFDSGATAAAIILRAGVSLVGASPSDTTIRTAAGGLNTIIACLDYERGHIARLAVRGAGSTGNAAHGIEFAATAPRVNRDITISDVEVSEVGSYGIGHQYGQPANFRYEGIYIHDVGADGIDHKVRFGPLSHLDIGTEGVSFERIVVERFGRRLTDTSGIDIRGQANITNVTVRDYGSPDGVLAGITLSAGISSGASEHSSSSKTVLTNFFVDADPAHSSLGVVIMSSGSVVVADGTVRRCMATGGGVYVKPLTATPFGFIPGPVVSNVVIEGSMHVHPMIVERDDTTVIGCKTNSEIEYFDARRGNLEGGQTVFTARFAVGSRSVVVKNGTVLSTSDYTYTGTTLTLATAVLSTDEIRVVHRSLTGGRVVGLRSTLIGNSSDGYTPMINLANAAARLNCTMAGNSGAATEPSFLMGNIAGGLEILVTNAGTSDVDLRLNPANNGLLRFGTYTAGALATTGYISIKDSSGNLRRLAVVS